MSDTGFIDLGDELVVRISGYPVGKARVVHVANDYVFVEVLDDFDNHACFSLPLDVKEYDNVDGVAHQDQPFVELA